MTSSILVPLDGSSLAEEALPTAVDLAQYWREPLCLAAVHQIPAIMYAPESGIGGYPGLDLEVRRSLENHLKTIAERLAADSGLEIIPVVLEGDVVDALAHEAHTREARVVVMTTHGRGGASRAFLGSIADRLIRHVRCPVLLTTPGVWSKRGRSPGVPRHVVVPLDGTPLSESVIDRVLALYPPTELKLDLICVVSVPVLAPPSAAGLARRHELIEQEVTAAREYLHSVAERLRSLGLSVETKALLDEQVSQAIVGYARAGRADLVAIATRGRSGAGRMLFGSVADKVVRTAERPVLVWNPFADATSHVLKTAEQQMLAVTASGDSHA